MCDYNPEENSTPVLLLNGDNETQARTEPEQLSGEDEFDYFEEHNTTRENEENLEEQIEFEPSKEPMGEEPTEEPMEEESIEEPMEEEEHEFEEEYDLGIDDYLAQGLEIPPHLYYHADPIFSDNSGFNSPNDDDPRGTPSNSVQGFLGDEIKGMEEEIRFQDEEEAYLSSLNDPTQAHLNNDSQLLLPCAQIPTQDLNPTQNLSPTQDSNPDSPTQIIQAAEQQTLRRSCRIFEQGETRRYVETKTKVHKGDNQAGGEPALDPIQKAQLLAALNDADLITTPLQ